MALFRRSKGGDSAVEPACGDEVAEPADSDDAAGEPASALSAQPSAATSSGARRGPHDAADAPADDVPRLDLGGLRVPVLPGVTVNLDTDGSTRVTLVHVLLDGSELQLAPFAAPRSEGIWDEIRAEIAEQIRTDGGGVDDVPGPFGRELVARVTVRGSDGRTEQRTLRFVGVDGPRWFLRGVVTGAAATSAAAAQALESVFAGCVVVRGQAAMPPRDLLGLHLPEQAGEPGPASVPSFDPFDRGPEITEVR